MSSNLMKITSAQVPREISYRKWLPFIEKVWGLKSYEFQNLMSPVLYWLTQVAGVSLLDGYAKSQLKLV